MAGFGEQLQAAAPVLLGIGSQASGRDPAGIARGVALLQAKDERDKRKAAIDNLLSGMGISGQQRDFLSTLPQDLQSQWLMQQMAPQEPVRGVPMGDRLVNPYTGDTIANYGPEPLPDDVVRGIWGDAAPVRNGIFAGESGGDYNALFGYSNRPGGDFSGVNLTSMTVDDAIRFSQPDAPYAQWVKDRVGRIATPMGAYQVVGTTLRAAKEGLGLRGDEKMTPETQERIGKWIYDTQGTGAWEGYRGPASGGGGAQPPSEKQSVFETQIGAYDNSIGRLTAVLASGAGTKPQREQLEYKRKELEARRDALIQQQQEAKKKSAAEEEISRLMETGLTRQQAIGLQSGRFELAADGSVVDKVTGDIIGAPAPQAVQPPPGDPGGTSSIPPGNYRDAFGVGGLLARGANWIADVADSVPGVDVEQPAPNIQRAQTALTNTALRTVTMLQNSFPGRASAQLMGKLEEVAARPAQVFKGPGAGRDTLEQTSSMIYRLILQEQRKISNPRGYTAQQRSEAQANIDMLQPLLEDYREILRHLDGGAAGTSDDEALMNELLGDG